MPKLTGRAKLVEAHRDELHVTAVKLTNAKEDRDNAIREAFRDGVPAAVNANEVGMTRQGVYKVVGKDA